MAKTVKCAYCGRENVPVTTKGYMKPHVTTAGRRCMHVHIPFPDQIASGPKKRSSRSSRRASRSSRRTGKSGNAVRPLMPDMSWLHGGPDPRKHDLHERAAMALGWAPADARAMSLQTLRDAVRQVSPGLANEMTMAIQSKSYALGERRKGRRR